MSTFRRSTLEFLFEKYKASCSRGDGSESAEALLSIKNGGYPAVDEIKTEIMDDDIMDMDDQQISNHSIDPSDLQMDTEELEPIPELGPAALGLQRVGTQPPAKPNPPTQPVQALNRRGMPVRIRKKNKLFYDDVLINHPHHRVKKDPLSIEAKQSPRKMLRSPMKRQGKMMSDQKKGTGSLLQHSTTPVKQEKDFDKPPQPASPDRRIGQKIGMRLRNLLKLPKAHKWVCYEWFYSNIDKVLFEGDNDFMICLKESFPQLKTRKLTRVEWCKIRRMMGKPRRCSQSFFEEERRELERKRHKIRLLQQRKTADISSYKDLPSEIPLQLVIGTKVTARLRKPQDGLFTGSIDAVDTSNNTYRITFERAGLGTHSVPDYEVLSNEPPETISVASFAQKFRPRPLQYVPTSPYSMKLSPRLTNDPLISNASVSLPKKSHTGGTMNGYPMRLLELMVKVNKILAAKKTKITKLKEMNGEVEKRHSFGELLPSDFERKYAGIVVELERMNGALQDFLNEIQELCQEMAPEPSVAAMLAPSHLREKCKQEAADMVARNNMMNDKEPGKMNQLITDLTALMLQVKSLSDSNRNAYELKVLQGTMEQIRAKLSPQNQEVFQNCVEIHMQHIQLGLGQIGALTPFMAQRT
ncbi:protein lin-9 homolog isoform X1 [Linepithema humile]|uniref:protein lin-9 homolog isoform X1 n=2 Tax=Linepithema humile TaxID=83485 RepID=UPI0006239F02|nr:PREDICTED: protein lin-9 homolog isoform X2 [Linepithema humile]